MNRRAYGVTTDGVKALIRQHDIIRRKSHRGIAISISKRRRRMAASPRRRGINEIVSRRRPQMTAMA
jgi:hypothetical protein